MIKTPNQTHEEGNTVTPIEQIDALIAHNEARRDQAVLDDEPGSFFVSLNDELVGLKKKRAGIIDADTNIHGGPLNHKAPWCQPGARLLVRDQRRHNDDPTDITILEWSPLGHHVRLLINQSPNQWGQWVTPQSDSRHWVVVSELPPLPAAQVAAEATTSSPSDQLKVYKEVRAILDPHGKYNYETIAQLATAVMNRLKVYKEVRAILDPEGKHYYGAIADLATTVMHQLKAHQEVRAILDPEGSYNANTHADVARAVMHQLKWSPSDQLKAHQEVRAILDPNGSYNTNTHAELAKITMYRLQTHERVLAQCMAATDQVFQPGWDGKGSEPLFPHHVGLGGDKVAALVPLVVEYKQLLLLLESIAHKGLGVAASKVADAPIAVSGQIQPHLPTGAATIGALS